MAVIVLFLVLISFSAEGMFVLALAYGLVVYVVPAAIIGALLYWAMRSIRPRIDQTPETLDLLAQLQTQGDAQLVVELESIARDAEQIGKPPGEQKP